MIEYILLFIITTLIVVNIIILTTKHKLEIFISDHYQFKVYSRYTYYCPNGSMDWEDTEVGKFIFKEEAKKFIRENKEKYEKMHCTLWMSKI